MVTFTVSGLWHGASLNYVVWGAMNGAIQIAEGYLPARKAQPRGVARLLRMLATFVLIDLTWLFFRATSLTGAVRILMRMGAKFAVPAAATGFSWVQAAVLGAGIAALLTVDALHERGVNLTKKLNALPMPLRGLLALAGVLLIVVFGVWGSQYDAQAFIYFQF